MNLVLFRQEFAVRSLAWWIPIGAGLGVWVLTLTTLYGAGAGGFAVSTEGVFVTVLAWMALSAFLLNAGLARRGEPLQMTLPIAPRRVWLTHVAAIVTSGWTILAAAAAVIAAGNAVLDEQPLLPPGLAGLGCHLATGLALILLLVQSLRPRFLTVAVRTGHGVLLAASLFAYLGLVLLLRPLPVAYAALPFALALLLGLRTYAALPAAFEESTEDAGGPEEAGVWDDTARRRSPSWVVRRCLWGNWTWLGLILIAIYSLALSDSTLERRYSILLYAWVLLILWSALSLQRLPRLDALPVSRRHVFAVIALPPFATFSLVYLAATVGWLVLGRPVLGYEPPLALVAMALPWWLLSALIYRRSRGAVWVVAVFLAALGVVGSITAVAGVWGYVEIQRFTAGLSRWTELTWLLSALALAGTYRMAEAAFQQVEAPAQRGKS